VRKRRKDGNEAEKRGVLFAFCLVVERKWIGTEKCRIRRAAASGRSDAAADPLRCRARTPDFQLRVEGNPDPHPVRSVLYIHNTAFPCEE
jgi:hypothetical protein